MDLGFRVYILYRLRFQSLLIMEWKFPFANKNSFCDNVRWIYTIKGVSHSMMPSELWCASFCQLLLLWFLYFLLTGILLCLKMSKVRAEKPSSEMWKVLHFSFPLEYWTMFSLCDFESFFSGAWWSVTPMAAIT